MDSPERQKLLDQRPQDETIPVQPSPPKDKGSSHGVYDVGSTPIMSARGPRQTEARKWIPVAYVMAIVFSLYSIYVGVHLPHTVTEEFWPQAIIFHALVFMLMLNYLLCVFTSPGEVPKEFENYRYSGNNYPKVQMIERNKDGCRRSCKWCAKFKPDRSHHCRVCKTCVLRMDHHCPWVYNCIGFRNHKYFFLLLLYSWVTSVFMAATFYPTISKGFESGLPFSTMFFLTFGFSLTTVLSVTVYSFWSFHVWLMFQALTTIEFCEKTSNRRERHGISGSFFRQESSIDNIKAVLGPRWYCWLLPFSMPTGDGLSFQAIEECNPKFLLPRPDSDYMIPQSPPMQGAIAISPPISPGSRGNVDDNQP